MLNFLIFVFSLLVVVKSADSAIRYSSRLAEILHLSKHVVGFLLVAAISVLPETLVAIQAALQGVPSFGVGTLFGSNVADLTLIFALILFITKSKIKVESKILKDQYWYFLGLLVPLILGFNGYYSRWEGVVIVLTGILFHWHALRRDQGEIERVETEFSFKVLLFLLASMALLLLGSHFTVQSGVAIAESLHLNPALVGMLMVGLGTTLPELLFSVKAVKQNFDALALGDILGTVMTDATIVIGIVALIQPFSFDKHLVHLTGLFMLCGAFLLFYFMQSGKELQRKEGLFLFLFYILFIVTEATS